MRSLLRASRGAALPALLTALFAVGCGGSESAVSSGPTNPTSTDFRVSSTSVVNGALWKLNRPIDITFSGAIDFSSVGPNTIQIIDVTGIPALGTFTQTASNVVRWQPRCPTNDTNSNGGLLKNRTYLLTIVGSNSSAVTVRNTAGEPVESGITVSFRTPNSNDPVELFVDQVAGPPSVLIRGLGGVSPTSENVSYVQFGDGTREYLQLDFVTQTGQITSQVPLNLYSEASQQFGVVLQFNQPVNPSSSNISSNRIRLEYQNGPSGPWLPLQSAVALVNNCTAVGASVTVSAQGLVPQGSQLRVNVRDGFEDLTGDSVEADLVNFVRLVSTAVNTPGTADPTEGADEIIEAFTFGGGGANSREDLTADSTKPRASWGGGTVSPSFDFAGTGGPGGDFDWTIRTGQTVLLDTSADQIRGGPGGVETTTQTVINGVIDVRNLTVEENAQLILVGPNTATILASGRVDVFGTISANGGDNPGVKTLNTTNQPENGASGNAGGGTGGTGSFLTAQNTPQGGAGAGAFQRQGFGGRGGESCYATGDKNRRRGAGGGGGTFASSPVRYDVDVAGMVVVADAICQTLIGFDAEPGFPGGQGGTGAISQTERARGGGIGPFPFFDQFDDNNFFGTMRTAPVIDPLTMEVLEPSSIIIGELTRVWAGAGGGGGGDAVNSSTFPVTPFNPAGDEKGSGGGGGAGGIQILAIGEIQIRPTGSVTADGGYGGAGENVIFFDRVGGGGGGGSGGHIVMSSASRIIIEAEAPEGTGFNQAQAFYTDSPAQLRHPLRPVSALGGQGGAGQEDRCGANANGVRDWKVDAIPIEAFEGSTEIPPLGNTPNNNTFLACNQGSALDPEGTTPGAGGDGGPGIIQLHGTDLDTQIVFPNRPGLYGTGKDVTFSVSPPPLGWLRPTVAPDQMIPFFGDESESVSKWVALGEARRNPDGSTNRVLFQFGGTNLTAPALVDRGVVLRNGTTVQELPPAVAYAGIVPGQTSTPFITNGDRITFDATGLDEIYKKNPALARNFTVRLRDALAPTTASDFTVLDAEFDPTLDRFTVIVDPLGTFLVDQVLLLAPNGEIGLIPNYFTVVAGGVPNAYPANTEVRITFDATVINRLTGQPDEQRTFSTTQNAGELTPDIAAISASGLPAPPAGQAPYTDWDFVRFRVEFDLDASGLAGVNLGGDRPALDLLRIPFRF